MHKETLLPWSEVEKRIGFTRAWAHTLARNGEFPKPVKISKRASRWIESEIDAWVESKIQRDRADVEGRKAISGTADDDAIRVT